MTPVLQLIQIGVRVGMTAAKKAPRAVRPVSQPEVNSETTWVSLWSPRGPWTVFGADFTLGAAGGGTVVLQESGFQGG